MAAADPRLGLISRLAGLIAAQGFKKSLGRVCIIPRIHLNLSRIGENSFIHLFAPLRTVMP